MLAQLRPLDRQGDETDPTMFSSYAAKSQFFSRPERRVAWTGWTVVL